MNSQGMSIVNRQQKKTSNSKYRFLTTSKTAPFRDHNIIDPRLQRHLIAFQQYLEGAHREFTGRWNREDLRFMVRLEDFNMIRTIGVGGFGRVMLASKRDNISEGYYAIKIMDKHNIIKHKQIDHVMQELRILDAVNFTFLVSLVYYFKNNCYLFCVMPLIPGGEMFNLLSKEGKFDEATGKVYAAQVILAFEYLHSNGVIYRDLKPENILIDAEGYLKVTDYGFCKKIDEKRTWTLCGTPEYLAPEVILSQGYNFSVDWWTLGILIFEMIAGHPPFFAPDPMKLYALIVNGKYRMPDKFSRPLQHLIQNLIQTDRDKRYGVLKNGVKDIKTHEWFRELDWQMIFIRHIDPAHVPQLTGNPRNNNHFDTYKEEPLRTCPTEEYAKEFQSITVPRAPRRQT